MDIPSGTEITPVSALPLNAVASRIRRCVSRDLVIRLDAACLYEVTFKNNRRADILAILPDGKIWIIEVKSGRADFMSDSKWQDYLPFCDLFSFATGDDFPSELIPAEVGHFITDGFEVFERQPPATDTLPAARRKAMTLMLARLAARRAAALSGDVDPALMTGENA